MPVGLESPTPPMVIGVLAAGAPSMEMVRPSPPLRSTVTPGRYLRNSVTLPSATAPNSSVETTFLMLAAKRCSLIAMAAPLISRDSPTVNWASFTMSPRAAVVVPAAREMSCVAVWPTVTRTVVRLGGAPV